MRHTHTRILAYTCNKNTDHIFFRRCCLRQYDGGRRRPWNASEPSANARHRWITSAHAARLLHASRSARSPNSAQHSSVNSLFRPTSLLRYEWRYVGGWPSVPQRQSHSSLSACESVIAILPTVPRITLRRRGAAQPPQVEDGVREQRGCTTGRRVLLHQSDVLLGKRERWRRRGAGRRWQGGRDRLDLGESGLCGFPASDHRRLLLRKVPPVAPLRLERLCAPPLRRQPRPLRVRVRDGLREDGRVVERPLRRHRPVCSREQQ
mmetsp:Transcript_31689/g.103533  ORF Transcript_31689/g.103533 Transcript_31689/m.103533 type:complete len:264 (-) Transcript_31689:267-1058(-)